MASLTFWGTPSITPNPKKPTDAMPAINMIPVKMVLKNEYSSPFDHGKGSGLNTEPVSTLFWTFWIFWLSGL